MSQLYSHPLSAISLVVLLAAMPGSTVAGENPAASVEFIFGTANIVSADGASRSAEKGSPVFVGDTVITETARVQLRFSDGGFVGLLPRSEFKVNAYTYNGTPDGEERVSMALLKGGLRTISGLIGKVRQSAYEMVTLAATIGIRGTEYTVLYGDSITGTVGHGRIAVCNSAGCLDVGEGQSYYVKDQNTKPTFSGKAASLPPPQPTTAGLPDGADPSAQSALLTENAPQLLLATQPGTGNNAGGGTSGPPGSVGGGTGGTAGNVGGGTGGTPGSVGGGTGGVTNGPAMKGIGFELIGSTAPNVENPAQRVSDYLHSNTLPDQANGLGYGKGGKPR